MTIDKIKELDCIELLPYPPYSPDLAPSDYYLFKSMAHFLRGTQFKDFNIFFYHVAKKVHILGGCIIIRRFSRFRETRREIRIFVQA